MRYRHLTEAEDRGLQITLLMCNCKAVRRPDAAAAAEDGTAVDTLAEDGIAENATAELYNYRKGWTLIRRSNQILTLPWTLWQKYGGFLVVLL